MAKFTPGTPRPKNSGRRKGSRNKRTVDWEMFREHALTGGLEKFIREMKKLRGKNYVHYFVQMLEFHKPKLSRTTIKEVQTRPKLDLSKLTDDELLLLRKLQEKISAQAQIEDEDGKESV